jgi:two-component system sensor histidine kinase BarA
MSNIGHQEPFEARYQNDEQRLKAQVKILQQRLETSEIRQHQILEALPQIVWRANREGEIIDFNRQWQNFTGITSQEAQGYQFIEAVHPDDQESLRLFHRHLTQIDPRITQPVDLPHPVEFRLWNQEQQCYCWFQAIASPLTGENNQLLEWMGTYTNIHQQKQATLALRQSEKLYRLLAENSTELISTHTPEGIFRFACPTWGHLLGCNSQDLVGVSLFSFLHPEDVALLRKSYQALSPQSHPVKLFYRIRSGNGYYIWFETTCRCVPSPESGQIEEIILVSHDVSECRQIEAELELLHQEYRQLAQKYRQQRQTLTQLQEEFLSQEQVTRSQVEAVQERFRNEQQRNSAALFFLVEVSTLLASSLDCEACLPDLARLITPFLADWCAFNLVNAEGVCRCVAVSHQNRHQESWVWQFHENYPPDADGTYPLLKRLRNGETDQPWQFSLGFNITDERWANVVEDKQQLELLHSLHIRSYLCLPIRFGRHTFGSLLLVRSQDQQSYNQTDIALAEEVSRRAAIALDKSQIYHQVQETGRNLTQAILVLDEQQQQLRTLLRLTNLLNQRVADLPGLLQVMVDAVCEAIPGAQFCLMVLHNHQTGQLELTATSGTGTEHLPIGQPLATEDGLLHQVFSTGQSELICHDFTNTRLAGEYPTTVYAVAIESAQAGRLGVLAIGSWENGSSLELESWQQLLVAAGEQAAIAINNAQLINMLEEREELVALQNHILATQNQELAQQREQIQLQNLKLLEAARLKSQFLATMSHELRTPLNAIIGFSQVLLRGKSHQLPPPQTKMVQTILNNGKNLLMIINDILDLSQIEAGARQIKLENFNLHQVVRTSIEPFYSIAESKKINFAVQINLQNSCILNDKSCLRQVLVNLVSNAIKFTDSGRVQLIVQEMTPDLIEIIVQDTGIGIAESELTHIFEAFRQVDQALSREYAGTGLGLAITYSLVRLMQGKITVESSLGQGSTFRLELPRHF